MRNFLVVGILVAILLAIVVGLLSFRFSSFLAAHRGRITEAVAKAIGRPVDIDDVGVAWHGGLSASVSGLRIGEDPTFGAGSFLEVAHASVIIRIWPALFGEYEIRRVQLDSPHIRVIRDNQGFNFESLSSQPVRTADAEKSRSDADNGRAAALLIGLAQVDGGTLTYVDRTAKPPSEMTIDQIDLVVANASLDSKVQVDLRGRVLGPGGPEISVTGEIGPVGDTVAVDRLPIELRATTGPLVLNRLKQQPAFASRIPDELSSDDGLILRLVASGNLGGLSGAIALDATDAGLTYGDLSKPPGTKLALEADFERVGDSTQVAPITITLDDAVVHATAAIDSGKVLRIDATASAEEILLGGILFSGLDALVNVRGDVIDVPRTSLQINGAPLAVRSTYDVQDSTFSADLEVRSLDIKPLLETRAPEVAEQVDGRLDADLQLVGRQGPWPALRDSLKGNGRIDVTDGTLHNVNLVDTVLAGATGVQGLTQLVSVSTRRKYPGLLESADTVFETLHASVRIADGVVSTKDLRIRAPEYEISGHGDVRLDNQIDFQGVLLASEKLTSDIVDSVKIAKHLRNAERRLEIPFRLKGSWPQVRPRVDNDALMAVLGRGSLGKGLAELLGGGDKKAPDDAQSAEPQKPKDLLRQGLKELFGR